MHKFPWKAQLDFSVEWTAGDLNFGKQIFGQGNAFQIWNDMAYTF